MGDETQLASKTAALAAAGRLHASAGRLEEAVARACQLVEQTQQAAPLWGDDEAGRQYRANYARCEQLMPATRQLATLLRDVAKASELAVETLIDSDERATRSLGG